MELVSIIIPCYNEGNVITITGTEIVKTVEDNEYDYEIIFVDDGSKDDTLNCIKKMAADNVHIKYISFSRNFGKEGAMLAGLRHCRGTCAIIMDADLQHPPQLIDKMYLMYKKGYDQVIAKRNRKGDSLISSLFAKGYYKLANGIVNVEIIDGVGDFRLLSRRSIDAFLELQENNRFSKGLFSWIGFPAVYIEYENQNRVAGETKWSFRRLISYGIDGILSFNTQPLRLCIYLGLIFIGIDLIYLIYLLFDIFINGVDVPGYFTTLVLITGLGGVQLLSLGIIGEYIGRIYLEVKKRPNYIIQESNVSHSIRGEHDVKS